MKKPFVHSVSRPVLGRRNTCLSLLAFLTSGLGACQPTTANPTKGKTMTQDGKEVVYFDVSANSYYGRPIFDITLNGIDIGVGGGGLMTGVAVPLGPQVVTWRLDGVDGNDKPLSDNGKTVKAINEAILTRSDPKLTYLGVHIYPDNTIELIPSEHWPERTERGQAIINQAEDKKHGK